MDTPGSIPPAVNFEQEIARCEAQMFRVAIGLMCNEADALDAVQEALIRAYTRLGQFRGDSQFSTWLCRIVHHTCYDELRRRRRRPLLMAGSPPSSAATDPGGLERLLAGAEASLDPAEIAERREVQVEVRQAVGRLEPLYREVVVRRDLCGESYGEIAAALAVPPGTVKSRLNRARVRLRVQLAQAIA